MIGRTIRGEPFDRAYGADSAERVPVLRGGETADGGSKKGSGSARDLAKEMAGFFG